MNFWLDFAAIAQQPLPDSEGYYWSLTRHKETRELTKNAKLFLSHYGTGMSCLDTPQLAYNIAGMLNRDGQSHRRLRRIVSTVFTPSRLTVQAQGYGDESVGERDDSLDAFYAINAYGEALGRKRRKLPGDDLLSVLVAAEVDGERLSDLDIGVYFQLLITAGIDTTASSIAQGVSFLAKHPDQ